MQDIIWIVAIVIMFRVAYSLNAWVVPFVLVLFWPEFGGVPVPLSLSNGQFLAMQCMMASFLCSRWGLAFLFILLLSFAGSDKAKRERERMYNL